MNPIILSLSDPLADLENVGGKGMSLARLSRAGLPVPGGFHITTTAYRQFVAANSIQDGICGALQDLDVSDPAALERASRTIAARFAAGAIPSEMAQAITAAYQRLDGAPVAVRSSATAEDLPGASFAGQQETFLNILGADALLEAVKKCWASLWTARAIAYRHRQAIPPDAVTLAVVVQIMVFADSAGVLFTANPINGKRDELMLTAAWGLGEAVVSGAVTPDTLVVDRNTGKILRRETADKQVMTVRTDGGTREAPVPETHKKAEVLTDAQAAELAKLGAAIEALYAMPMDIEWTWTAAGGFAIVQARPITALPFEWRPPSPKGVYMRTSIADLMPKPLSPLFVTWGIPIMVAQMDPVGTRLTRVRPVLQDDYFTSVNQYAYMNAAFPAKSWWWIVTGLLASYPRLLRTMVPLWRDELLPEYRALVSKYQGQDLAGKPPAQLWHEAGEILRGIMYYSTGLMFATMGASAGAEALLTRVYEKMVRQAGDPEAAHLLMGWDNIPVRAEKSLFDLAAWCREQPGLTDHLLSTASSVLTRQLGQEKAPDGVTDDTWRAFQDRFAAHTRQFGYIVFQLDFAEALPMDDPTPMLENIKMYLRGEGTNPHERQQHSEALRIQMAERALSRLKGFKRWLFTKALNWGQSMAAVREDALAEIGVGYPALRARLQELGSRFVQAGAVAEANDIFWLEAGEVDRSVRTLEQGSRLENLHGQVEERKTLHRKLMQEIPPPMMPMKKKYMGFDTRVWLAESEGNLAGATLKGTATSAGSVTAPACILHGPEDFGRMHRGDVLVAGTTTPAWTPLFAMASAVVTDIGGPLSHGSIVAREYGIPAVMGTGVATRRIKNGQVITVDGSAGTVTLG